MINSDDTAFSGWVLKLILINIFFFIMQMLTQTSLMIYAIGSFASKAPVMTYYLGLTPGVIMDKGYVWQLFSYMFLHSTYGFFHIFFNMYALLIFGSPIEQAWGSRRFVFYYFFCGTGAGIAIFIINIINQGTGYYVPTIGASGAVFGLLIAFGLLFPDTELLLFFFLPIKAKYLVLLYGALELYFEFSGGESGISHIGHLGGLFFGLIYFLLYRKRLFLFKTRLFRAQFQKSLSDFDTTMRSTRPSIDDDNRAVKIAIMQKLRSQGYSALNDDEVQLIKYLEIMIDGYEKFSCPDHAFGAEDPRCEKCDHFDACFLKEVKKFEKLY